MARRGQCRCGLVLTFRRTRHGYKMRCPSCGAVVRLQVPVRRVAHPAENSPASPSPFDVPLDVDVELLLPELRTPPDPAAGQRRGWMVLAIVGALVLFAGVVGLTWWLLR